jgi:hypothetical protein
MRSIHAMFRPIHLLWINVDSHGSSPGFTACEAQTPPKNTAANYYAVFERAVDLVTTYQAY